MVQSTSAMSFEIELLVLERIHPKHTNENWQVQKNRPHVQGSENFLVNTTAPENPVWVAESGDLKNHIHPKIKRLLPEKALKLGQYLQRLNADTPKFRPLLHLGWQENVSQRHKAKPWFFNTKQTNVENLPPHISLNGLFSVYLYNNYLFIDAHWVYQQHVALNTPIKQLPHLFFEAPFKASQRVRSQEVHFFDHPLGGMFVEIRQI